MTSSLSNATNPPAILTASYGPNGPYGYTLGNGLIGSYTYDTLGRLATGNVVSGSTNLYNFTATWTGSQLQTSYDSVLNQGSTYGYDEFNRLVSRTVNSGTVQNFAWTYDRWGNRTQQNLTAGSGGGQQTSYSINTATNQIVGLTYDAAGNLTNDGTHTYTYDAEGNVTAVDGGTTATYTYDALNHRVRTVVGTTATEFVFNAAGQRVSEWNGSNYTPLKGHYYWGSKPVAYYTTANAGAAATHFEHQDWMGTERARTTYNGAVEGTYTSLPYGDNSAASGTDTDANHYAMLDHDSESGTDHAQFRQYGNTQGRFMSPDPYDGSYDPSNPQSFNRYAYALNNPLTYVDPSGMDCVWQNEDGSSTAVQGDCPTSGPGANGSYINCDGCTTGASMYFWDTNGNFQYFCNTNQCIGANGKLADFPGETVTVNGDTGTVDTEDPIIPPSIPSPPSTGSSNNPGVPKPPDPILKYAKCSAGVRTQASKNKWKITMMQSVSFGNLVAACAFAGPDAPVCVGGVGIVGGLVSAVNWVGAQAYIWDHESQCLQQ